jgi:hypothetical protein
VSAVPTRFVHIVGWEVHTNVWWGTCPADERAAGHRSTVVLNRGEGRAPDGALDGALEADVSFPPCERCGATFDPDFVDEDGDGPSRSAGSRHVYNTDSGNPEPGDMFWSEWLPHDGQTCSFYRWTNCDGRHLNVVLPNGHTWDVDARASNCDLPGDTEHRCWVRSGNPEEEPVTVGKSGRTCGAGAGSILAGDYHGFLTDGELRSC